MRRLHWLLPPVAALLFAGGAGAEIYKCQGPDGTLLFTADASQCPGTSAHELKGQVQSVQGASTPPPARVRPSGRSGGNEAAERHRWVQKKQTAQQELRAARHRLEYLDQTVKACNRGSKLWADDDSGVPKSYPCDKVRTERGEVAGVVARLEQFLDHGLEDECRRSGCLPGWIR